MNSNVKSLLTSFASRGNNGLAFTFASWQLLCDKGKLTGDIRIMLVVRVDVAYIYVLVILLPLAQVETC